MYPIENKLCHNLHNSQGFNSCAGSVPEFFTVRVRIAENFSLALILEFFFSFISRIYG